MNLQLNSQFWVLYGILVNSLSQMNVSLELSVEFVFTVYLRFTHRFCITAEFTVMHNIWIYLLPELYSSVDFTVDFVHLMLGSS